MQHVVIRNADVMMTYGSGKEASLTLQIHFQLRKRSLNIMAVVFQGILDLQIWHELGLRLCNRHAVT